MNNIDYNTQNKKIGFEVYTVHPETKEEGWDIKFVEVIANDYKEAKEILSTWDLFDCVILHNYTVKQDSTPYYKHGVILEVDYHYKKVIGIIK